MIRNLSVLLFIVSGAVTTSAGPEQHNRTLRTMFSQSDLEGVWTFNSVVPLQRPPAVAERKFFTKEEIDARRASIRKGFAAIAKLVPVEAVGLDGLDNAPLVDDLRTSLISYPENGRLPALVKGVRRVPDVEDLVAALGETQASPSQASLAQFAALFGGSKDSYADFTMAERCLLDAAVPLVPQFDDSYVQIIQGRNQVVLVTDFSRRIVALDDRRQGADQQRYWSGTSTGRWEGETLVVETRAFNDRTPSFAGAGNSRDKVVTERFKRTSKDTIEYSATINDPQTFQDRIELSFKMARIDTLILQTGCHEGNYSLRNALAAARLEDDATRRQRQKGPRQQLTVFDRTGAVVARIGEPGLYSQAALSPDASRVAVIRTDIETGYPDVWTFDVATGRGRPLTSDKAVDTTPLWSPDGREVAYSSVRDSGYTVFRRAADGTGTEEQLYRHDTANAVILTDWSRDGRFLTFWSGQGMFILPLTGNRQSVAIGPGRGGRFSSDGHWLAYNASDAKEPGRFHAFVRPFNADAIAPPAPSSVRQVSQANAIGGLAWRSDGRELYFLSQSPAPTMMVVELNGSEPSTPEPLFQLPLGLGAVAQLSSISSPDGQRFLFAVGLPAATAQLH